MSILGKLVKTGLDLAVGLPVAVAKDVVTGGGMCTDQIEKGRPYTADAVLRLANDCKQVRDEADKL